MADEVAIGADLDDAVLIAVDAFKGSITAGAAVEAIAAGWRSVHPSAALRLLPMADGGEGTLDAFATAFPDAQRVPVTVSGPTDGHISTEWLLLPDRVGVIELARTSGIELFEADDLAPMDAHTRGFGEAIRAALAHGVTRLVLCVGGSASTDAGAGMLQALGARLLDADGVEIPAGGRGLAELASVDLSTLTALPRDGVTVLTDVTNPLLGALGAARVFGPQKGADDADIAELETGLARFADVAGLDPAVAGAGAAGGTGAALLLWGATLVRGSVEVARMLGVEHQLATASLVVTGEGSFDSQSEAGKVVSHVVDLARAAGTRVALVAGRITEDADTTPFGRTVSLTTLAGSAHAAMADPARWLHDAGASLAV